MVDGELRQRNEVLAGFLNFKHWRSGSRSGDRPVPHPPPPLLDHLTAQELQSPTCNGARVQAAEVIQEEFGVDYHPAHVRKVLHQMSCSVQRPTTRLVQADPKAQKCRFATPIRI